MPRHREVVVPLKRLTPEEARELVERHGSQRAAARAIRVPRSTFRYWLDPEPQRERAREHYYNLTGLQYNLRLLQKRRQKGLQRMAARNQRLDRALDEEDES